MARRRTFRHLVPFAEANYESPVAIEDLPDIPFTESAYIAAPLKDHHDGILTAPGWLLRHQTNRGRANRFYGAFLCAEFLPTETALEGDDPSVLPSPDLQRRSGCLDCHARLEPWAAYWGRWREAGARYHSDEDIPAFSEECSVCAVTGTSLPGHLRRLLRHSSEPHRRACRILGGLRSMRSSKMITPPIRIWDCWDGSTRPRRRQTLAPVR